MNRKWSNGSLNCEAYNSFDSVGSDHRIVSAKIRLSLRANKIKSNKSPKYDWSVLKNQPDITARFKLSLTNRYAALQSLNNVNNADSSYKHFEKACQEATEEYIPSKPTFKKRKPWENENIVSKRKELKKAAIQRNVNPTTRNINEVKEMKRQLRETYENEQKIYLQSKIDEISNAADNKQSALAWKTVHEIAGRNKCNKAKLKAKDQEERLTKWKTHFQNLLGTPPKVVPQDIHQIIPEELNIKTGDFTMNELDVALKKVSNNKACGLDQYPC